MSFWQIGIVVLLFFINGFLAMSEMAVVSSRRARLVTLVEQNVRGSKTALSLVDDPTRFLSTVQVGITLVGVFAGAYSGATLSDPLAERLATIPAVAEYARQIAIAIVVVLVTYFSLIIGELVPKRIAQSNAERIACFVARPMDVLGRIAAPIVWFLRISTEAVLALLRVRHSSASTVTEEEVKTLIAEGTETGVFHQAEREMLEGVIKVADRSVRSIMVPRPDVIWIDIEDDPKAVLKEVLDSGHSRFPASRGEVDEVEGVIHVKDLLEQITTNNAIDVAAALREPLFVDEHMPILRLLDRFKTSPIHMAIILDEHGSFEGIVTLTDILAAIAGDLPEDEDDTEPDAVRREDGSWLLSGRTAIDDAEGVLGVTGMAADADFQTLAGFVLHQLGHIPSVGEAFNWNGWRFEVVDLDARRIDKVVASALITSDDNG
ncbi:MAG: HlyC/CorC family transporter [Bauldia sp.]|nr:HlyC/CorC family transporter [Bauldia sp.]